MSSALLISILAAAISSGTPLLFACLGELLCERSGILNLGVEGMMLVGAVSGFLAVAYTNSLTLGVLAAIFAGGSMALIHAFMTVTLRVNQVVSGLALTLFGTGLSGYLGRPVIGKPLPTTFRTLEIPFLADIPFIGPILFRQDLLVYLSFILVFVIWYWIYRTRPGLHLRATGESPETADSLGVKVFGLRYFYVIMGGVLAGLGGAYLSLAFAPSWLENMTAGRGWIAVALVIFAVWNPLRALFGSYLFGGIEAIGYRSQVLGIAISPYILRALPYLFTILVLILVTVRSRKKRLGAPAKLGQPYSRE